MSDKVVSGQGHIKGNVYRFKIRDFISQLHFLGGHSNEDNFRAISHPRVNEVRQKKLNRGNRAKQKQ